MTAACFYISKNCLQFRALLLFTRNIVHNASQNGIVHCQTFNRLVVLITDSLAELNDTFLIAIVNDQDHLDQVVHLFQKDRLIINLQSDHVCDLVLIINIAGYADQHIKQVVGGDVSTGKVSDTAFGSFETHFFTLRTSVMFPRME